MSNNILLGISGSVACSKTEILVSTYSKNFNFKILSTFNGLNYISDKFIEEYKPLSDWSDLKGSPHIELARWADIFLIYPASANLISKLANGIADDLLTSTYLMYKNPVYIAPAMHEEMYLNPVIQNNVSKLSTKNLIIGPRFGSLDIGDKGLGRLIEPDEVFNIITKSKDKIIVTSGPTTEKIDDVKVISNTSSGKQGRAIAIELLARGYEVIYVHSSNIEPLPHAKNKAFSDSKALFNIIEKESIDSKYLFMTAAVSDFIINKSSGKISRDNGPFNLTLNPNIDVVKAIKEKNKNLITIGFSAQVNNELNFEKLKYKNIDFLVINNILDNPFGSKNNKIYLIDKDKLLIESGTHDKNEIANIIIDTIIK